MLSKEKAKLLREGLGLNRAALSRKLHELSFPYSEALIGQAESGRRRVSEKYEKALSLLIEKVRPELLAEIPDAIGPGEPLVRKRTERDILHDLENQVLEMRKEIQFMARIIATGKGSQRLPKHLREWLDSKRVLTDAEEAPEN